MYDAVVCNVAIVQQLLRKDKAPSGVAPVLQALRQSSPSGWFQCVTQVADCICYLSVYMQ